MKHSDLSRRTLTQFALVVITTFVISSTLVFSGNPAYATALARAYPDASISSPAGCAHITKPTSIIGTAYDANLQYYTLEYRRGGSGTALPWVLFSSGTTSITNNVLGTFSPTMLKNGVYTIRLTAVDWSGQITTYNTSIIVTGRMKLGQVSHIGVKSYWGQV